MCFNLESHTSFEIILFDQISLKNSFLKIGPVLIHEINLMKSNQSKLKSPYVKKILRK